VLKGFERQEVDTKTESMPGVIMENGSRNGSHTNHDRDQRPNGVNGVDYGSEKLQEKGKGRAEPLQNMTPTSPTIPNGLVTFKEGPHQNGGGSLNSPNMQERVNQLPPEIVHITENYQSLQSLLSRLAQKTHNDLTAKILELAQMPVPASAVNGNASHIKKETITRFLGERPCGLGQGFDYHHMEPEGRWCQQDRRLKGTHKDTIRLIWQGHSGFSPYENRPYSSTTAES
jgi:hypothetical protein